VGSGDAFVVKLSADGSTLVYSTFLGGSLGDAASGISVDGAGNAHLIGSTCSHDFPATAGAISESQISRCGIVDLEPNGDIFVAKLNADGNRLLYSTYLGGGAGDEGTGIAIDTAGNVYVTGRTNSLNFPTTPEAFEPGGGPWDAFVAKISTADTNVNPGTLGFDAIGYSIREDAGTAVITVIRRNGRDGEVSVDYTTNNSNFTPATAGLDYIPASGTLVFANGESSKSFTISILDDKEHEGDERLVVTLSNVRGGALLGGNRPEVWLLINDQDPIFVPTLTVTKAGSGTGTVRSNFPRDINCGSVCSRPYGTGTSVTLTAVPALDSTFVGWSGGGCSGTGSCTLTMTADTWVTAIFDLPAPITPLALASTIVPEGEVNNGYNAAVAATGGVPSYNLTVVKGSLPPGLVLKGLQLIGTPVDAGKFKFTLQLTDSNNVSVTRPFTIRIFKSLAIKTDNLPSGRTGQKYSGKLAVTGGKGPYSWSLLSGDLPSGLNFDPTTGRITGVPTAAGIFAISFRSTDVLGGKTEKTVGLNIR
jgi:Calx-beta domain-containing protein/putative Ig domain-containing protein/beta-propeller repeat-containing protein/List-Bact-rpt repeat protein